MSDEDEEDEDGPPRLVCIPEAFGNPGGFDDNVRGKCAECGAGIIWRPHAPPDFIRVCILCFAVRLDRSEPFTVAITPETLSELAEYAEARLAGILGLKPPRGH